ncbi:DsrE family protein [Fusibacter tunisiensis]|uniref:Intracellular sulfur oxidation DsrE/DsrF family protein n=1 Tax=Fusibacter tunisiensis TaxID=1008308 RepID=A0ABS2MQP3_9FIRM|nr:DsrE family protein [Fusibacter tunisiensis]MBM7561719.1 intracellular sulfur oxidation DsrE/DsrF family protein [Fusibacter tunisiensis]
MTKVVYFAFNGDQMCFVHVLLNVLEMSEKGYDVKIVMEGEAVKLIEPLETSKNPLYIKAKEKGLIDCICKACSAKLGVLEFNETVGIPVDGSMSGHPSMAKYLEEGFKIITL